MKVILHSMKEVTGMAIMIKRKIVNVTIDILWVVCGIVSIVGLSLLFAAILASIVKGL